ncbi:MAG: hypothetical protein IJL52_05830 [Clostridia bacterium]|nr:hypothetical protein [Clostridia bacterium]
MKKKSILIIVLAVLLCAAIAALVVIKKPWVKSDPADDTTVSDVSESDTAAPTDDATEPTETEPLPTEPALSELILGAWTGGLTGVSGYEFLADGTVLLKIIDLDQILGAELPIDSSIHGDYTLTGDQLKINYRLGTTRYTFEYTVTVRDDQLSLFEKGNGQVTTFQRTGSISDPDAAVTVDDLIGAWVSADDAVAYTFDADGKTLSVTLRDAKLPGRDDALSGTAEGLYFLQNGALTLQFAMNGETLTVEGTCDVEHNTMSLTAADGSKTLLVRAGTLPDEATAPENLRGTWKTADGTVRYTFNEGNVVSITYTDCNVAALQKPISGTYPGVYTLEGTALRLIYTAYDTHITENWTLAQQEDGSLLMTDTESAVTRTLTR